MNCFKTYDVRGKVPEELNEDIAYRIGRAYAEIINPQKVVVGRDCRLSGEVLCSALAEGLLESGVDVFDIGMCGTEEVYFATFYGRFDGGIMVTASHNPIEYNGMKFVKENAKPINGDDDLFLIRDLVAENNFKKKVKSGSYSQLNLRKDYIKHLLNYINIDILKPLKILVDPGNGCAWPVIERLMEFLPFEFSAVNEKPDGSFPNGVPNPLLPEKRLAASEAVRACNADFGIAWDGDFDRCFFFDETGAFIEGYYIVGLLAAEFLKRYPGEKIVHDPRLIWNTIELVDMHGGIPIESKTGHAFIKAEMRRQNAIYGGEMSAHHYFRDFSYCDSGMIPWLLMASLISESGKSLNMLVKERMEKYPASGEINRRVDDVTETLAHIRKTYEPHAKITTIDGLSADLGDWRFNVRPSNTEPLLRLNVESRADRKLMERKTRELLDLIGGKPA